MLFYRARAMQERIELERLGGMRHQSAACFAESNPGARVLVVSQDGRTSLMWRGEACVNVLAGIEHLLPVGLSRADSGFANRGAVAATVPQWIVEATGTVG